MVRKNTRSILYFTPRERKDLLISWVTLSLAFAVMISPTLMNIKSLFYAFPIALFAVGTGFVFHELAHREAAKAFGFYSEFRAWYPGLVIALILAIVTMGEFTFAAPGATYFFGTNVSRKQNGIISAAGPAINIIIGMLLIAIAFTITAPLIKSILVWAGLINFWFAFFNLIPIYPLDGSKIIIWDTKTWLFMITISAILVFGGGYIYPLP